MKTITITGILLIVLGVLVFVYQGVTYTKQEKILEVGPIQATRETSKTIPLSPILGAVAIVGGVVLIIKGDKRGG